mgnify:CR=1 FL=1
MFDKILIANRGEIACRVARTCRRMGVATVAVYSSADRAALHVEAADAAVRIGAAPSSESYLNIGAIVEAARATGAQAIHPGYGFLSENADFADACADAGIVFIGPSAAAIRAMGSKAEANRIMAAAGVPVLPGGTNADQTDGALGAAASAAGYPVMVKPAAGGGGRGMRVVRAQPGLAEALASARREAKSSFGDATLLVEKYVENPRHIEVQIFGDAHGNAVHLFERDCSAQRRHQKVIEEAPAPGLSDDVRSRLFGAAVAAARAVDYVGAGTVEFLLGADGDVWFMEMNTRLQVEHPVTEMVTGIDLVEWQLRIAAGEKVPLAQDDIRAVGHAIEARLYAEDPAADFTPGFGRLVHLSLPEGEGLRVDTGVREGDEVTVHYDPMIAKIVAHGPDRETARARLYDALARVRVAGPATNEAFLRTLADHPDFRAGGFGTGFIAGHLAALAPPAADVPDAVAALAALAELTRRPAADGTPWSDGRGWRLGGASQRRIVLIVGKSRYGFLLDGENRLSRDGEPVRATGRWAGADCLEMTYGDGIVRGNVFRDKDALTVFVDGVRYALKVDDPLASRSGGAADAGSLFARMPGVVVAVPVSAGDAVSAGAPLIVVEAMKVEHTLRAPADGTVTSVPYKPGDRVAEGAELIGFAPA